MKSRNLYWGHFRLLEEDALKLSRYVEFDSDNYATYSIQLVHLILAVGSEIDVIFKDICHLIGPDEKAGNICDYKQIVVPHYSRITNLEVVVGRQNLVFKPWSAWGGVANPDWWSAYNAVKHERNNTFGDANLKNFLNALSALFVLNVTYHHACRQHGLDYPLEFKFVIKELVPKSDLFHVQEWVNIWAED